jgi:hypothetical protein
VALDDYGPPLHHAHRPRASRPARPPTEAELLALDAALAELRTVPR